RASSGSAGRPGPSRRRPWWRPPRAARRQPPTRKRTLAGTRPSTSCSIGNITLDNYCREEYYRGNAVGGASMSWTVDPMHTQVEFAAKHMGIMTVKGHFTGVRAAINFTEDDFSASSVDATIDAGTLTTNDERRDTHLKSADF